MKTLKKIASVCGTILLIVVVILVIGITMMGFFARIHSNGQTLTLFDYSFGRVVSGSMEPEIPTGSFILSRKTPAEELAVGDVILFYSDDPDIPSGLPVAHRIVQVQIAGGQYEFETKGDANKVQDQYPARAENVIGKVIGWSPLLGTIVGYTQSSWLFLIIVFVCAILFFFSVKTVIREVKKARG
ncbi:MAG: signal peptidase I [Clostridia bacterium]|nr:signal peptidase I [Clostridia bacterium]